MSNRNNSNFKGGYIQVIIIAVLAIIALFLFVLGVGLVGELTGLNSGATTTASGPTSPSPAGKGSGVCTGSSVKAEPIRDPSVDAVAVSVPIWKYGGSQTSKSPSTMTLRVNINCTTQIKNIFQQAYNSSDHPPIKTGDTGCYNGRGNNTSMHNWGGACDINWTENYCIWRSGGLCGPAGHWTPGSDVLSIPIVSSITSAFSSEGWSRGLWTKKLDYMHYSVNGY